MSIDKKPPTVLQVLPALNSGGVERGTVDFASYLVQSGHQSIVMSSGGRLVAQLQQEGSQHITFPVHRKSLLSFLKVRELRKLLAALNPDLIHVRSRMPAWLVWQALKHWPLATRPALVSTFHGLYSVSFYSAIMGCGDCVIAISNCVRDYIVDNYPKISLDKIYVVHRGVDQSQFNSDVIVSAAWRQRFERDYPNAAGKSLLLMPGRLSSWKGHRTFIAMIERLLQNNPNVHGLIVGDEHAKEKKYLESLKTDVATRGLQHSISFLGHRSDMPLLYKTAAITFNLSERPEPFGRTVIESLAVGTPVIAYDSGGPAESLRECCTDGLVPTADMAALLTKTEKLLCQKPKIHLKEMFTSQFQCESTLKVYADALQKLPAEPQR